MKKETLTSILYAIASVCFFIAAGIGYANNNSYAAVWLCLGAAMLCIRTTTLNKAKEERENGADENDKCQ